MELPISPTTGLPEAEHGDWADVLSQQLNQYTSLCCRPCRLRSLESAFFFFPFSHRHSQFRSVFPPYVSIFFVDAVGYQWNGAGTTFTFTCRGTLCCTGLFFSHFVTKLVLCCTNCIRFCTSLNTYVAYAGHILGATLDTVAPALS